MAGALRVTIDPGDDYFATTRLMEESNTLVATEHDAVIGVYCGTLYAGRLNVSSLTARLERAPDLYSWDDVWIADGAVVGIGRVLQGRITEGEDGRRDTTRALVFDHGFLPGAEDRYRDLLAARGAAAAHAGASHLSVFTTEPSRTHPILLGLADSAEDYDVLVPGKEPADDAVTRGLYVDQIHF